MVRTRNTRSTSGGSGQGGGGKDTSPSFKPSSSGNKKGRKRQLTDSSGEAGPGQAAVLTPRPGTSTALALLGPGTSYHQHRHAQAAGESSAGWADQGFLAPAAGPAPTFNNNSYQNNNTEPGPELAAADTENNAVDAEAETGDPDIVHSAAADLVIFSASARDTTPALNPTHGHAPALSPSQGDPGLVGGPGPAPSCAVLLPDDLKQNLECPVCARISLPPIMQCRNGHVTCNPCRLKVQSCPMCREIDIDIRNLFAEKAVTFMTIPCEFRTYGCRVEIQYKDKEVHERACKFRPYICPYIECDHKLAFGAVVEHVSTAHREECRRSDGPEITASMILIGMYFGGDGAWSPRVITCFGKTFFDVALTRDRWLHHWVWLLGEEEEASQYTYEITAFKGNTKYVYGSEVASLRTSDDEIVSEGKCLSISDAIGRRLRDGDKIRYKLKLNKKYF